MHFGRIVQSFSLSTRLNGFRLLSKIAWFQDGYTVASRIKITVEWKSDARERFLSFANNNLARWSRSLFSNRYASLRVRLSTRDKINTPLVCSACESQLAWLLWSTFKRTRIPQRRYSYNSFPPSFCSGFITRYARPSNGLAFVFCSFPWLTSFHILPF